MQEAEKQVSESQRSHIRDPTQPVSVAHPASDQHPLSPKSQHNQTPRPLRYSHRVDYSTSSSACVILRRRAWRSNEELGRPASMRVRLQRSLSGTGPV